MYYCAVGYFALVYLCFRLSFIISFYQLLMNKDQRLKMRVLSLNRGLLPY